MRFHLKYFRMLTIFLKKSDKWYTEYETDNNIPKHNYCVISLLN